MTSGRQGLFRQLCDQATQQCVAAEYLFGVVHLVKYIPLADGSISASSYYAADYVAKRIRIDNYFNLSCAWGGKFGRPDPLHPD